MKRFIKVPVFFLMALVIMEPAGFAADQPLPAANNLTIPDAQSPTQAAQAQANAQQLVATKNNILSLSTATLTAPPVIQNFYDAQGRLIRQDTYVNGQLTESDSFSYNASGQLTQRLQSIYDPSTGKITSLSAYYGQGTLAGKLDSKTTYTYNASGVLTQKTDYQYYYDGQGNLFEKTGATYNAFDALIQKTEDIYNSTGQLTSSRQYTYDPVTGEPTNNFGIVYNSNGTIFSKTFGTFNAAGWLTTQDSYYYDSTGTLTSREQDTYYPSLFGGGYYSDPYFGGNFSGITISAYFYNSQGVLVDKILFTVNASAGMITQKNDYQYSSTGQLLRYFQFNYGSSTSQILSEYEYDGQGKLLYKEINTYNASGVLTQKTVSSYDSSGQLTTRYQYNYNSSTGKLTSSYQYNGLGILVRKTTYTYSSSGILTQTNDYQYNSSGQLVARYQYNYNSSTGKITSSYQYNGLGILVRKITYTYSASGILTQKNDYQYNSTGLLTTRYQYIYDPSTGRLIQLNQYDGLGNLIKTTNY